MSPNIRRWFFLIAGHVAVVLGVIGIVFPGLPTTPFILLASWCYSKSSPKFHARLRNNPRFGQNIRDWENERAISGKAKRAAVIVTMITLGISMWYIPRIDVRIGLSVIAVCIMIFIITRPLPSRTRTPDSQ